MTSRQRNLSKQIFNMSYFLSITGSHTKFSKSGFLLRALGSILEEREIDFRAIHALDLPPDKPETRVVAAQFIADAVEEIELASAIVIVIPANKESTPALLTSLLDLLPEGLFSGKPVLLFVTGGFPGHVAFLERSLSGPLFRLGTKTLAARVHIGTGSWIIVGDDRPRLSRTGEREAARAIDLALEVLKPEASAKVA
jgi:FMN reductase